MHFSELATSVSPRSSRKGDTSETTEDIKEADKAPIRIQNSDYADAARKVEVRTGTKYGFQVTNDYF